MMMPGFNLGDINQHGYVVTSVEKAALWYAEKVGAGPFYVGEFDLDNYRFLGEPQRCRLRIGTGYWGALMLEFIELIDAEATLYARSLPGEEGRINHFGINVADIDAWVAERSLEGSIIQSGEMRRSGVRFVYLDSIFPGGIHLELVQGPPQMLARAAAMAEASAKWDRRDPIRPMSALATEVIPAVGAESTNGTDQRL